MTKTRAAMNREEMLAIADDYEAGLKKMEASGYEEFDSTCRRHWVIIAALRASAAPSEPAAWQWRYVGHTEWKTPSGGAKLTDEQLEGCGPIEQRPLYASLPASAAPVDATEISDQAMRELLSSTNVGQGRHRLKRILSSLSSAEGKTP